MINGVAAGCVVVCVCASGCGGCCGGGDEREDEVQLILYDDNDSESSAPQISAGCSKCMAYGIWDVITDTKYSWARLSNCIHED